MRRLFLGEILVLLLPMAIAQAQQPSQPLRPSASVREWAPVQCSFDVSADSRPGGPVCPAERYSGLGPDQDDEAWLAGLNSLKPIVASDLEGSGVTLRGQTSGFGAFAGFSPLVVSQSRAVLQKAGMAAADAGSRAWSIKAGVMGIPFQGALWSTSRSPIPVGEVYGRGLPARAGDLIDVRITRLVRLPGYLEPDPVLWLVQAGENGDPESGEVLVSLDDGPGGVTAVQTTVPSDGRVRVIVVPTEPGRAGRMDIEVSINGKAVLDDRASFFGGHLLRYEKMRPGEVFLAGALGKSGARSHDAVMFLLPPPGQAGAYLAANNTLATLPGLFVRDNMAEGLLVVSAFEPASAPRLRILRTATPGAILADDPDDDSDGLVLSAESALGTCDSESGFQAGQCRRSPWSGKEWSAADTDGDSFSDLEEVFGIRVCYESAPEPPLYSAERVESQPWSQILGCGPGQWQVDMPLSAMDGPSPNRHDVYFEVDAWVAPGVREFPISQSELQAIRQAYEKDWLHGTSGGQYTKPPYPFRVHTFLDQAIDLGSLDHVAHLPSSALRNMFFNLYFSPIRKYSNVFYYVLGLPRGSGQSDVVGRTAMVGLHNSNNKVIYFVHETGHLMGLQHNGEYGEPTNTPFYLSIMSYAYSYSLPPSIDWDGTFGDCSEDRECMEGFRCTRYGTNKVCAPDCGNSDRSDVGQDAYVRFSSGQLGLGEFSELAVPETGYPRWFLPYLYCASAARGNRDASYRYTRFRYPGCKDGQCVTCVKDECSIDWNRDGAFSKSMVDVDGNGTISAEVLRDWDDRQLIYAHGHAGLNTVARKSALVFYSPFGERDGRSITPFPSDVSGFNWYPAGDATNVCDEKARWSPCRGSKRGDAAWFEHGGNATQGLLVTFPADACPLMEDGVAVSLRIRVMEPGTGSQVVIDTPQFSVTVGPSGDGDLVWTLAWGGPDGLLLSVEDPGGLGQWNRVTVDARARDSRVRLHVRRGSWHGEAVGTGMVAPSSWCDFSVAGGLGAAAGFTGFLDDLIIVSGPVREL